MTKNNTYTTSCSFKRGKYKKKQAIFGKIRPYKERQEKKFETVETQNYDESKTRYVNASDTQNTLCQIRKMFHTKLKKI